jgi:hypothetical protein
MDRFELADPSSLTTACLIDSSEFSRLYHITQSGAMISADLPHNPQNCLVRRSRPKSDRLLEGF